MTISQTQLVDILYKKLSGVSKTDTSAAKSPANESNASPQLSPGSTIWQQDYYITSVTTLPTSNSSVVTVYRDSTTSAVQSVSLSESVANETWATNLTDWIPPQFGAGYQVKLYAGPSGSSTPQNYTNLPVGGSGNNDSWYFDYSAGIVNFADTNVPTPVAGNVVYVVGARYTGPKGINNFANLQIGNITINGNTITGNTGVTFGGNVTATNFIGNIIGNINGSITGDQTVSNLIVTGNTATGNILTNGFFYANGSPVIFSNYGNANVSALLGNFGSNSISTLGNISAGNVVANFYGNILADTINPYRTTVTVFNSTTAIGLPSGNTVQRPATTPGYLRYNNLTTTVEYANGTSWIPLTNSITDQTIIPNGTGQTYTLDQATTSAGIIVSINGTLQRPDVSYTVSDNQITFAEIPLTTDIIDVRFIATAVTTVAIGATIISSANIAVSTSNVIIDSFDSSVYRSAKYTISSSNHYNSQFAKIMLVQNNGTVALNTIANVYTGANTITYSANVSGTTVNLLATGTSGSDQVRVQKTYFTI